MKRLLPLLLVCAVLLPLCALGETAPAFADEGVRSAVCLQLGLDASGLTAAALSSLTELTIDGSKTRVRSLTDLSLLPNLQKLTLLECGAVDLSPLAEITSLTDFLAMSTDYIDYTPMLSLPRLERFVARGPVWDALDLSPLAGRDTLKTFFFPGEIADLAPLFSHKGLERLELSNVTPDQFRRLARELPSLVYLSVSGERLESADLAALAGLPLERLSLANARKLRDPAPLAALKNLTSLTLYNCGIADVSALSEMTSLQTLDLRENPVTDLSPLAALGLEKLEISADDRYTETSLAALLPGTKIVVSPRTILLANP